MLASEDLDTMWNMEGRFDTKRVVGLLKSCVKMKHLEELHVKISERWSLSHMDVCIGNTLIDMYAKCGSLAKAQLVFDELPIQDVVSWNTLISAYAKHDHAREAFCYFKRMKNKGFSPNVVTYLCVLKACSSIGSLHECKRVHATIIGKYFLASNLILGNALVDMYAKCGLLAHAQEVFDSLPLQDVISWNALITGYTRHDLNERALHCFEQMQCKEISPNTVTFISILKACGQLKAINTGMGIHNILREKLLHTEIVVGNALIDMYAKCGFQIRAQKAFDELPIRDIISWTTMIAGFANHKNPEDALKHFEQMRVEGLTPNAFTFVSALKACRYGGAIHKGIRIHAEISREGLLEKDYAVANALVDMYANCGHLRIAWEILVKLPVKDILSWNILIGGYGMQNCPEEVLRSVEEMQCMGVCPNDFTFICVLRACSSLQDIEKGIGTHAEIARKGLLDGIHVLGNALIDMYCNCSSFAKAQEVFDNLLVRDLRSWTALIAGYGKHNFAKEVLCCTSQMHLEGIFPDSVTFVWSLKACMNMGALCEGIRIHIEIARMGWLEWDVVIGSTLVEMYAQCYSLARAQEVFDMLVIRDVVSWNALITAYCEYGHGEEALNCYDRMRCDGVTPDAITFMCSLKACSIIGDIEKGHEIYGEIFREGLFYKDLAIGNAVVTMYAECGFLREAIEVFDMLPVRDTISWNSLITGYANHERGEDVLNCFNHMQHEGVSANIVTFICVLKACGSIGAGNQGTDIHAQIYKEGLLVGDIMIENALIYMYAKCGMLERALDVLENLPMRDMISWTSLIAGYTDLGDSEIVLEIFERMIGEGIKPDSITLVGLLNACSHGGLVDQAQRYFKMMSIDYGINPTLQHYTCIIDLFGRAGHLDKMLMMIEEMPFYPDLVLLQSVLDACKKWGTTELGKMVFTKVTRFVEKDTSAYIPVYNNGTQMEVYAINH